MLFSAGAIATLIVGGVLAYRPKFRFATMEEVKGEINPELLKQQVRDPKAEARFERVRHLLAKGGVSGASELSRLEQHIAEGPITQPRTYDMPLDFPYFVKVKSAAKLYAEEATSSAMTNPEKSARALVKGYRLLHWFSDSTSITAYLVHGAIQGIMDQATIVVIRSGKLNERQLRELLAVMPVSQLETRRAKRALHLEFQESTLPMIPRLGMDRPGARAEEMPDYGTYDAMESARWQSALVMEALVNLDRPYLKRDFKVSRAAGQLQARVPEDKSDALPDGLQKVLAKFWYTVQINNHPNAWGRWLFLGFLEASLMVVKRQQAEADLMRALVAIAIQKKRHGTWPSSLSAAGLGTLRDPFSELPFGYDPVKGLLWSTGRDGKNDGGKIGPGLRSTDPDFGLSFH
jgi:hypothetical protein